MTWTGAILTLPHGNGIALVVKSRNVLGINISHLKETMPERK
jgi:hypothetical protein